MKNLELINEYFCNNDGVIENGILYLVDDDCGELSATYRYMLDGDDILESHCGHGPSCFSTGWEYAGSLKDLQR